MNLAKIIIWVVFILFISAWTNFAIELNKESNKTNCIKLCWSKNMSMERLTYTSDSLSIASPVLSCSCYKTYKLNLTK